MHLSLFALALTLAATTTARAAEAPLRVAVLDFTNAAPDPAWDALGKGLQSMVTTDLSELASGRDDLQVIERARLVDLQSELKLGASGAVDPKTAAKLGKLAGASHLVAGSFTVVGNKMRLDARMIAVATGDVAMTANVEGDKDAFFELEKDLVRKLVESVGVKLQPKERAKLNAVHTADLEAFRAYSEGIAQFDAKKYDEALKNLEKAARLDDSFDLAKRTLAQYEQLARDARGHADAAADAEAERARLLAKQAAVWDGIMLDKITKKQASKDTLDRAIATSLLIEIFDPDRSMNGKFKDMRDTTDPFVLQRLSDRFAQQYVADAKAAGLKTWLYPFQSVWGVHGLPEDPAGQFEPFWNGLRAVAQKEKIDTLNVLSSGAYLAKRLHLDEAGEIDLVERALRQIDPEMQRRNEPSRRVALRMNLAEAMLKMGLTDRAAKLLSEIRTITQDAEILDEVADNLAMGVELHAELAKNDKLAAYRREFFALNHSWPPTSTIKKAKTLFTGDTLSKEAVSALQHFRQISATYPGDDFRWIGDTLMWPLAEQIGDAHTGPGALDPRRAPSFRWFYGGHNIPEQAFFMAALGEVATRTPKLALTVDFQRAADWNASRADKVPLDQRPSVTVLFALRDLLGKRPLDAYGIRFQGGDANLVHVVREPGKKVLKVDVLDTKDLGLGKKTTIKVEVGGGAVAVTAGAKSTRFTLKSEAHGYDGFAGLLLQQPGYVEISDLKLAP